MNKSKFLKKSLAMLLALMLVLAMIPLSASAEGAETPVVNYVYVGTGEEEATLSGEVWSAEIVDPVGEAVPVKVELDGAIPGSVAYYNALNNKNEAAENTGLGVWEFEIPAGETSVDFVVIDAGNQQRLKYTVSFTTVARDGDTSIKEVKLADAVEYDVWSNDNGDYTVVAPYDYNITSGKVEVTPTADTSTVYYGTSVGATTTKAENNVVPVTAYDTKVYVRVVAQNNEQTDYTITVVEPIPFATFSIEGERHTSRIERVEEDPITPAWQVNKPGDSQGQVEVYLPYGAEVDDQGNYYFTPVFTTNYDVVVKAVKTDKKTEVELVSGETYNLKDFATSIANTTTGRLKDKSVQLKVYYSDTVSERWSLGLDALATGRDVKAEIKGLAVNNYVATIEGNVINLELPASVRANANKIKLTMSQNTTVDFVNTNETTLKADQDTIQEHTLDTTANFFKKDRYTLRVTAAYNEFDKTDKAVQDYTLNITTAQVEAPKLNTVTLKSEKTGEELVGRIDGANIYFNGKNAIPYRYHNVADMAADEWQLFWSASSGTTITSGSNPIATTGTVVDEAWAYLPDPEIGSVRFLNNKAADATIDVANEDQTQRYTIHFTSAEASQDSTLGEMKLAMNYVDSYDDLNDGNTVEVKVTTATAKSTLEASVYYSDWDAYTARSNKPDVGGDGNGAGGAAVVTELPTGAKLYWVDINGVMWEIKTLASDGDTLPAAAGVVSSWLDNVENTKYGKTEDEATAEAPLTLVVVSEAWAENITTGVNRNYTNLVANKNAKGLYTPYELTLTCRDPRIDNTLDSLSVYDAYTGTEIMAEKNGEIFTLTLPAYMVDTNRKSVEKLYLNYGPNDGGQVVKIAKNAAGTTTYTSELYWLKTKDGSYDTNDPETTALKWDPTKKQLQVGNAAIGGVNAAGYLQVTSEAGLKREKPYEVRVKIADANTKAVLNSVSYNGSVGTPNGTDVTLNVPFNTEVTSMALDFNVSENAYVIEGTLPTGGVDAIARDKGLIVDEGETFNFLQSREFTVVSEDHNQINTYTITVVPAETFSDVAPDQWYYDVVNTAAGKGWINGVGDGKFNPNGTMTRGDFALIVARIMGYDPEDYAKTAFPDVASSDYYSAAIAFCKEQGIIDGDDLGNFNPKSPITREQMAKIICQAKQLKVTIPEKTFDDDAKIAEWAKGYVYACQEAGIMEGDNGSFRPTDNATRAEGAAVLVRAFA